MTVWKEPNRVEVAAMWLYSEEYAMSGLSAVDFFAGLSRERQYLVRQMVGQIVNAKEGRRKAKKATR